MSSPSESAPGEGSTFSLEIPLVYRPAAPDEPAAAPEPAERDPFRIPVLVVEDAPDQFAIYESLLRNTEFQLLLATSVQGARHALRDAEPKAIILDIQLRGQDAWAFLAEVKSGERRELPVLVVTNVGDEVKALGLGADAFFPKPAERPWLLHTLRSLTRSARRAVLAIDDDELSRYTLQDALRGLPFEFLEAASGEEGFARARREQPSAVFLDLNMPDQDGFAVLARLKADESDARHPRHRGHLQGLELRRRAPAPRGGGRDREGNGGAKGRPGRDPPGPPARGAGGGRPSPPPGA